MGGLVYITRVPSLDSEVGEIQGPEYYDIKIDHHYYYSPQTLRRLLNDTGFEVIKMQTSVNFNWLIEEHKNGRISDQDFDRIRQNQSSIEVNERGELIDVVAQKARNVASSPVGAVVKTESSSSPIFGFTKIGKLEKRIGHRLSKEARKAISKDLIGFLLTVGNDDILRMVVANINIILTYFSENFLVVTTKEDFEIISGVDPTNGHNIATSITDTVTTIVKQSLGRSAIAESRIKNMDIYENGLNYPNWETPVLTTRSVVHNLETVLHREELKAFIRSLTAAKAQQSLDELRQQLESEKAQGRSSSPIFAITAMGRLQKKLGYKLDMQKRALLSKELINFLLTVENGALLKSIVSNIRVIVAYFTENYIIETVTKEEPWFGISDANSGYGYSVFGGYERKSETRRFAAGRSTLEQLGLFNHVVDCGSVIVNQPWDDTVYRSSKSYSYRLEREINSE
jgi:hypothetical protein